MGLFHAFGFAVDMFNEVCDLLIEVVINSDNLA